MMEHTILRIESFYINLLPKKEYDMPKKIYVQAGLLYFFMMFIGATGCVKGIELEKKLGVVLNEKKDIEAFCQSKREVQKICETYQMNEEVCENLEITCKILEPDYCIELSDQDYEVLCKVVEAEATGEDFIGKQLVANVVINRVKSDQFPDNITDVVYQQEGDISQFSPVSDGRIDQVVVSEETKNAVMHALLGQDESEGALYFANRKIADVNRMKWFDERLTRLFIHGNHEFFI